MDKEQIMGAGSSDGSEGRVVESAAPVQNTTVPASTNSNKDTGKFDVASTESAPVQNTTEPKTTNSQGL